VHTRAPLSAARKTYAKTEKESDHNRHKEQQQKSCMVASFEAFGAAAKSGASEKLGAL
jgi:hypothetical protein